MKILVAQQFFYPRGGDWTYTNNLIKLYESKGHKVIPFGMMDTENIKTEYDKYFVSGIDYALLNKNKNVKNAIRVLKKSIYSFEAKKKISRLIEIEKPNVVHLNNIHKHITPSVVSAIKSYNIPIMWTMHGYQFLCPNDSFLSHGNICESCKPNRFYQCILKKCKKDSYLDSTVASIEAYTHYYLKTASRVDMFIAPSIFLRNKFIEFGFNKNTITHLPNFLYTNSYEPKYSDQNYVIFYGRISEEKGLITLLKAMKILDKHIILKVIGRGPQLEQAINYCNNNGLSNVEFLGFKSGLELSQLIQGARFTVIPSEWYENLPFTMLESFCYGKPVIATDIGELSVLINNYKAGELFEYKDHEDLAKKINLLWHSKEMVLSYGKNARRFAEENLNPEYHYSELLKIIHKIMGKKGGS